jgi:hypothetical protein
VQEGRFRPFEPEGVISFGPQKNHTPEPESLKCRVDGIRKSAVKYSACLHEGRFRAVGRLFSGMFFACALAAHMVCAQ